MDKEEWKELKEQLAGAVFGLIFIIIVFIAVAGK